MRQESGAWLYDDWMENTTAGLENTVTDRCAGIHCAHTYTHRSRHYKAPQCMVTHTHTQWIHCLSLCCQMSMHSSLSHTAAPPHVRPQTQAWMQTVFSVISKLVIMRAASLLLALLILHMNAPWQQHREALQKERSHRPVNADTTTCDYGRIVSWKTTDNTLWAAFLTGFHAAFLEWDIKSKETISGWYFVQSCEDNNQKKTTVWAPNPVLPAVPTVCLPYFTSDMINSTERHLCHRLFWSGNRGAIEYDRRKQSLRECPPQVGNVEAVRQAGHWLKLLDLGTQTRGKETGSQGPEREVSPWMPTNRSGNSLRLWLVCVQWKECWIRTACLCAVYVTERSH